MNEELKVHIRSWYPAWVVRLKVWWALRRHGKQKLGADDFI